MRSSPSALLLLAAACGGSAGPGDGTAAAADMGAANPAPHEAKQRGCLACHAPTASEAHSKPLVPLVGLTQRRAGSALAAFLEGHYGARQPEDTAGLVAFLRDREPPRPLAAATVASGAVDRGGKLWSELGCVACHDASGIAGLAQRTDHAYVNQFLRAPGDYRPDLVHDFDLRTAECVELAAW